MATTRHRSLVRRSGGRGFVRDRPKKKKKIQHTDTSNLKSFEQIELQAKLLNYFLGSNKSNINQSMQMAESIARCRPVGVSKAEELLCWLVKVSSHVAYVIAVGIGF